MVHVVTLLLAALFSLPSYGLVLVAPDMAHFIMNIDPLIISILERCLNLDNASSVYSFAALIETSLAKVRSIYDPQPFSSVERALEYSKLARYPIFHNNILSLSKLNHNPKCAEAVIQELNVLGLFYHCQIRPHAEKGLFKGMYPLVEKLLAQPDNFINDKGIEIAFISDDSFPFASFIEAAGPRLSLDGAVNLLNSLNCLQRKRTFLDYFGHNPMNTLMFVKIVNASLLNITDLPFEIDAQYIMNSEHLRIFVHWINLPGIFYFVKDLESAFSKTPQQLIALLSDVSSPEERQWICSTLIETLYTLKIIGVFDTVQHQSTIDLVVEHIKPWDLTTALRRTFVEAFTAHLPPYFVTGIDSFL